MTDIPASSEAAALLSAEIAACRLCKTAPQGAPLPHEPRPVARLSGAARILVAGQAPGRRAHDSGLPFDDRSGDRLRDWMGLDRPAFYNQALVAFLPMGFCFPGNDSKGGDLPPRRECRAQWHARALAAMPQISLLLLIGAYAQDFHLRRLGRDALRGASVDATVANWRSFAELRRPQIFALPHPSWRNTGWLNKNPWFYREVVPCIRSAVEAEIAALART